MIMKARRNFNLINFVILAFIAHIKCDSECLKLEISITQKVEKEGFHRNILWLIKTITLPEDRKQVWMESGCKFVLSQDVPSAMFVNPDEIAELSRIGKLLTYVYGSVDIEAPAHEASDHIVYIYLNRTDIKRTSISIPIHLRYQKAQITGGNANFTMKKPSLLLWCPGSLDKVCGRGMKIEAPCDDRAKNLCIWKNFTYRALFDEVELFVPVGDLDDYPLVSIVTLFLGCAGCVYILSVLSTTPL